MVTVNVQANAVKGRQAHEVATEICRSQKWKDGHAPASIKIELAPCARGCFASSRDAKRFEQAVHRSATAHQHVAAHGFLCYSFDVPVKVMKEEIRNG